MSKRKFQEISRSGSSAKNRQQERFLGYFENGQHQLLGSLKIARGFERQKLGRRQKDAAVKDEQNGQGREVERIEAEIQALKALDLSLAAEFYIARTLCRIKTIASTSIIPERIRTLGQGPSPYRSQASANVTARLFKSALVKNSMETVEEQIRSLVKTDKKKIEDHHDQPLEKTEFVTLPINHEAKSKTLPNHTPVDSGIQEVDIADLSSDDGLTMDHMSPDGTYINQLYEDRLASDSDASLDSIQGLHEDDISGQSSNETETGIADHDSSQTATASLPAKQDRSDRSAVTQRPQTKAPVKTTFLPSLAAGYISGSDSESQDDGNHESREKPKRKNRMGQQARRALAEQQYGASAKHLQNGKANKKKNGSSRDAEWDYKRGAVDRKRSSRFGKTSHRSDNRGDLQPTHERKKSAPRVKDDVGALHPSWIAKKKMKEAQNNGVGAFQGKKVVFD